MISPGWVFWPSMMVTVEFGEGKSQLPIKLIQPPSMVRIAAREHLIAPETSGRREVGSCPQLDQIVAVRIAGGALQG